MNTQLIESLVNYPLVVSVGWMLVHFVWQATLVGVIVALVLATLRRQTASARYSVACIGLAIMTIMPLATLVWLIANADAADWMAKATPLPQTIAVATPNPGLENNDMRLNFQPGQLVVDHETEVIASGAVVSWSEKLKSASRSLQGWLPWCVLAWFAGVVCLAMRLLIGMSRIRHWYRDGAVIVEGRLHDAVKRLAERMNLKHPVRLLESARATVPAVIGCMRPAILVPASMLSGLTTAELESILAHELAHIRRHDYLVNLLQSVVETVLFYHPAVWWLSHRIRSERENCCDDIAVAVCGDRVVFAQALARMEEIRCGDERLVVAANGGSLLGRIRRIVGAEPVGSGPWWPAGAIVLGSLGLLLSGIWITAAMAEPAPDAVKDKANHNAADSAADSEDEYDKADEEIKTRKSEFMRTDSKTGIDKRVFGGIELTAVSADKTRVARTEMIYSNLFMYSFIPARIAKEPFEKKQEEPPLTHQPQDKSADENEPASDDKVKLDIRVVEKDGDRVARMAVDAFGHGRTAVELVKHFSLIDPRISRFREGASVTNMETIVSAVKPNYEIGLASEAADVLFSLPEGSGMRAEFSGEQVEMTAHDDGATVVVTGGRVDLIDARGVIRAWASPDGGAEQLVIDCTESNGEVVLSMRTRRRKADADYPNPPVQFVMNIETGASADEQDPPHRGIRYEMLSTLESNDGNEKFVRLKMKWYYDLKRLAEEAEKESGLSLEELIHGKGTIQLSLDLMPRAQASPSATGQAAGDSGTSENSEDDTEGWGDLAQTSGLRSRLTLTTENPTIGQPLIFKLEVKNFSDKPTEIDPQRYAPFRVLRVENEDFSNAAPFIGMTPQTAGQSIQLEPGQTHLLWENVDASQLYLLAEAREYDIVARGGEWAASALGEHSNRIKVALQHGALSPLQQVIAELLPELPSGWKLSSGFGGIYISHSPTNLKADATNIQLVFLDEEKTKALSERKRPAFEITFGLGMTVLGEAFLIAPADAANLWRNYKELIEKSVSKIRLADRQPNEPEENNETTSHSEPELPWSVSGIVTDAAGEPFAGVTVKAHTGFGTLFNTGSGVTDENGRYEFPFGPGFHGPDPKLVQAATISVSMAGFTEKNLHRQGDCIAALEQPDEIDWGDKTTDDLFLPGESKEINFVMVPAATMKGVVISQDGDQLAEIRVSLVGEDMPPSSSVAAHTRTDKGGKFELTGIPTGFKFQLLIEPAEAKPPWQAWASPPLVFTPRDDGLAHIEYSMNGKPVDFSFQHLFLTLNGNGVNWKTALKDAGNQPLELSWDGLSTEAMVSASMAFLQLGENNEE